MICISPVKVLALHRHHCFPARRRASAVIHIGRTRLTDSSCLIPDCRRSCRLTHAQVLDGEGLLAAPPIIAIDLEHIHFRGSPDHIVVPGEVCIVNAHGTILYHSYCRPDEEVISRGYVGGVRKSRWREAPPLQEVAARVSQEIQGKILVGHGLQGDLEALGLIHPRHLKRDTMTFRKFQSKGHARKLSCLAADLLGKDIQVYRHSAREDATAAMQLYLKYIDEIEEDPEVLLNHHLGILTATIASKKAGSPEDS